MLAVFVTAVLGVGLQMVVFGQNIFQVFGPSPNKVQQLGQPLVDAINDYHNQHGTFPKNLNDADIDVIETVYGPFEYLQQESGQDFQLTNGDYMRDGFVAVYDGGNQRWYVDH